MKCQAFSLAVTLALTIVSLVLSHDPAAWDLTWAVDLTFALVKDLSSTLSCYGMA